MPTSPFKRLEPFSEGDAAFFFGRESEARLIASDLFASAFSVLYGESGVGKSSLLRAGVLPLLRMKHDVLPVLVSEWQEDPVATIKKEVMAAVRAVMAPSPANAASAESGTIRDLAALEDQSASDVTSLGQFLRACSKTVERRILLILDQFEEVFLYHSQDNPLFAQLPGIVVPPTLSVRVLISLREDAIAKLDVFEETIPQLFGNLRRVEHLTLPSAAVAISGPIARYNKANPERQQHIEPDLIEAVLADVPAAGTTVVGEGERIARSLETAGRIDTSHLQLVISRLWDEEVTRGSSLLRMSTFRTLGGADKIIRTHIDEVMNEYSTQFQQLACSVLRYLVTPSGAKVAFTVSDLADYANLPQTEVKTLLLALCEGERRILRPVGSHLRRGDSRYEVYHDRQALAILDWVTRFKGVRESLATIAAIQLRATRTITVGFLAAVVLWLGLVEPTLSRYAGQSAYLWLYDSRKARIELHIETLKADLIKLREGPPSGTVKRDKESAADREFYRKLSDKQYELEKMQSRLSSATTDRSRVSAAIVTLPGFDGTDPNRFVALTLGLTGLILVAVAAVIVVARRWVGALLRNHDAERAGATARAETTDVLGRGYGKGERRVLARMTAWMLVAMQVRLLLLAWHHGPTGAMSFSVRLQTALLVFAIACAFFYERNQPTLRATERASGDHS